MTATRDSQHLLPPQNEIDHILKKVHTVCCFGSTNKVSNPPALRRHALAQLANQLLISTKHVSMQRNAAECSALFTDDVKERALMYFMHHNQNIEPQGIDQRRNFLIGFAAVTRAVSYSYGFGNCEAMADIAFFEAVMMKLTCGITYLCFDNQFAQSIEEINMIALGDWPQRGCLLISPWEGECGKVFEWQGSCDTTPELQQHYFNRAHTIFSIAREDANVEKEFIQSLLIQAKYAQWLESPFRLSNLTMIRNTFLHSVAQCRFFKNHTYFLDYRDIVTVSRLSKENYRSCENIKITLQQELELQPTVSFRL